MHPINFFQAYGRSIRNTNQHENRVKQLPTMQSMCIYQAKWRKLQIAHETKLARYTDECEAELRLVNAMISYRKSIWSIKYKPMDLFDMYSAGI